MPATLADLTCDSDGKIDRFINPRVRAGRIPAGSKSCAGPYWAGGHAAPHLKPCPALAARRVPVAPAGPAWCSPSHPGLASCPARPPPPQGGDPLPALPLHTIRNGEKYYLVGGWVD